MERVFTGGGEPETMQGAEVPPGLFPLLGVAPELGRVFAPDEVASVIGIISHATWQTRFGVRVALDATRGAVIRHVLGRSVLQSVAGTMAPSSTTGNAGPIPETGAWPS